MVERPQTADESKIVAVLWLDDVNAEIEETGDGDETGVETGEPSFTVTWHNASSCLGTIG